MLSAVSVLGQHHDLPASMCFSAAVQQAKTCGSKLAATTGAAHTSPLAFSLICRWSGRQRVASGARKRKTSGSRTTRWLCGCGSATRGSAQVSRVCKPAGCMPCSVRSRFHAAADVGVSGAALHLPQPKQPTAHAAAHAVPFPCLSRPPPFHAQCWASACPTCCWRERASRTSQVRTRSLLQR